MSLDGLEITTAMFLNSKKKMIQNTHVKISDNEIPLEFKKRKKERKCFYRT